MLALLNGYDHHHLCSKHMFPGTSDAVRLFPTTGSSSGFYIDERRAEASRSVAEIVHVLTVEELPS